MSFPRYPEYKDSGVEWLGEVPAHWEVKRLRYVAELNPPKSEIRNLSMEQEVTFIPMEAIGEDGSLRPDQTRPIGEVIDGYTYVREGDVAVAKITPCFENGKAAIMRGLVGGVGLGTTELIVSRPKSGLTTNDYLFRIVTSGPFRALGEAGMYGAGGQKRVSDDFVRNFCIAWPPLPEQTAIAAFLDHETARIDALVEEQKRLIELLKEKRQAVISHAVTKGLDPNVPMKDSGVEWLGEVPAHWETWKLSHCLLEAPRNGISPPLSSDASGIPTFSIAAVRDNKVAIEDHIKYANIHKRDAEPYFLSERDVLIVRGNGNINFVGRSGMVHKVPFKEIIYPDILIRIRPKERLVISDFLVLSLSSSQARRQIEDFAKTSNGTYKISSGNLGALEVLIPPIPEQLAIVQHANKETRRIDDLIQAVRDQVTLLQERRSALISAAITGRIDVRGGKPPAVAEHVEGASATTEAV